MKRSATLNRQRRWGCRNGFLFRREKGAGRAHPLNVNPDPCETPQTLRRWLRSTRRFLRSTHAGATAITAAALSVMTVMGTALIIEHAWIVGKRDLLKAAADAASVAATLRLRALPADADEATVNADLQADAERYVWLNLRGNLRGEALMQDDVTIVLDINRAQGTVGVAVDAPIGRSLLGNLTGYGGPDAIAVGAGAEAGSGAIWAVLAIDISRTMDNALSGAGTVVDTQKRIHIVREAAKEFVTAVGPNADTPVAVGVVPWAWSVYSVLAPSTTPATITSALDRLNPTGGATASSRGLKKSRELLKLAPEGARKAIVLLTDGEDNRSVTGGSCGASRADCPKFRKAECDGAKTDGIAVFVIAAMASTTGDLAKQLRECASSADYAFINTKDAQAMRDTFGAIAGQIRALRRTY